MSFPSESDMMSKELQNSDSIYLNLMTDVFKIIVKYRWKIIAKYCHLSPSGNRALLYSRMYHDLRLALPPPDILRLVKVSRRT